jgi:AcrR family transcriptional regulator
VTKKTAAKTQLDWVDTGLGVLAMHGADAVKVEALAGLLGVTKGSFYWHFADRSALLVAMLERWEAVATDAIIATIDADGGSPAQRLERLLEISTNHSAAALESALRAWGSTDDDVGKALMRVDGRREGYVRALLLAHGLPEALAMTGARMLYLALIGEYACVAHGTPSTPAVVWRTMLAVLLG